MLNIPTDIAAAYTSRISQQSQLVGCSHNEQATIYHVWTFYGTHDKWEMIGGKWKKTDSRIAG